MANQTDRRSLLGSSLILGGATLGIDRVGASVAQSNIRPVDGGTVLLTQFLSPDQIANLRSGKRSGPSLTGAFDRAVAATFADRSRALELPAGVLIGPLAWPPPGVGDPRFGGYRLHGSGRGEAFAIPDLQQGTVISSTDTARPTLTFGAAGPDQGSGALDIGDLRVEGAQAPGVAALRFDALYGSSRVTGVDVYQTGRGDGVEIRLMATGSFDFGYALNRDWIESAGPRTGTGFLVTATRDCGLAQLTKTTARGWNVGYSIGREGGPRLFSTRIAHAECSNVTTGFDIAESVRGMTLDTCYFEGVETGIRNRGHALTAINPWLPQVAVGLDDTSDTNSGTVVLGGLVSLRPKGSVAIRINGTTGMKAILGTTVVHGGAFAPDAGGIGVEISGTDPRGLILPNLEPNHRWRGTARKIVDTSRSSDHPADAGSGLTGLAVYEDRDGRSRVSLERGAHRLHVDPRPLDDAAVSNGTLTLGAGSIYLIALSRPTSVNRIAAPNLPDKTFTLLIQNANLILENSPQLTLIERSGRFHPPAAGSVHHFQAMPGATSAVLETGRIVHGLRESADVKGAPREGNRRGDSWFFTDQGVPGYWNGTAWCRYSDGRPIP